MATVTDILRSGNEVRYSYMQYMCIHLLLNHAAWFMAQIICAGYCAYGSATEMVITYGRGVQRFSFLLNHLKITNQPYDLIA